MGATVCIALDQFNEKLLRTMNVTELATHKIIAASMSPTRSPASELGSQLRSCILRSEKRAGTMYGTGRPSMAGFPYNPELRAVLDSIRGSNCASHGMHDGFSCLWITIGRRASPAANGAHGRHE